MKEGIKMINEKGANLLKKVILKKYQNVRLDNAVADENEFYYEFKVNKEISENDLENLENEMKKIDNQVFVKLLRVSGVYFEGNAENEMITRISGKAFEAKEELEKYEEFLKDAKEKYLVFLVILFATLGADLGATINYAAGYYLGRPIIYRFANSKWGKMCLLNQEKVEKSERYFDSHGKVATITGRLIPGIRHLISIPAGLAKMHYGNFILYTTIGAGVWNCILAALGWYLHTIVPEDQLHDKILEYGEYIKWAIIALVLIAIVFFVVKKLLKKKN